MAIAYVEHPVTTKEKAEYRKKGFEKILDIRYKPEKLEEGDKAFPKPKPRKPKDE